MNFEELKQETTINNELKVVDITENLLYISGVEGKITLRRYNDGDIGVAVLANSNEFYLNKEQLKFIGDWTNLK
jgi:hypothetical protein